MILLVCLFVFAQAAAAASAQVEGRVESILGQMTLEEKIDMLGKIPLLP